MSEILVYSFNGPSAKKKAYNFSIQAMAQGIWVHKITSITHDYVTVAVDQYKTFKEQKNGRESV